MRTGAGKSAGIYVAMLPNKMGFLSSIGHFCGGDFVENFLGFCTLHSENECVIETLYFISQSIT